LTPSFDATPPIEGTRFETLLREFEIARAGQGPPRRREDRIIDGAQEHNRGEAEGPEDPGDPGAPRPPPNQEQVRRELAREILRIHEQSFGKGAGKLTAIVEGDWVVVLLDDVELMPNERFLIEHGEAETVTRVRMQYQLAIQSSLRAAVERATGRTVVGFTSAPSVEEPRFVAEIFKLR
jgi:uncharacterized protein YbcI